MAGEVLLSKELFETRVERLYKAWDGWTDHGPDALVFLSGRQDEERSAPRTDQLHLWLFGYVFPETLVVLLKNREVFFLTGPKKGAVLRQLNKPGFQFLEKGTEDTNKTRVQAIFDAIEKIRESSKADQKLKIGKLLGKNEIPIGPFAEQLDALIEAYISGNSHAAAVGIDSEISLLLAQHDDKALAAVAKAAKLAVRLAQEVLVLRIEHVLDNELKESHADIAGRAERALDDKKKQDEWKAKDGWMVVLLSQFEPDCLDLVYANVQSGEACDLRPSAMPKTEPLNTGPGTIIVSVGSKYADFTANIIRTLLFNANKEKRQAYTLANETLENAVRCLSPGTTFKDIHDNIQSYVKAKASHLVPFLTKTFGHAMGIEFRDSTLCFNGKCTTALAVGMTVNISVGFANVPVEDDGKKFSIWVGDTAEIRSEGPPVILTADFSRSIKFVSYEFEDTEQKAPKKPPPAPTKVKAERRRPEAAERGKIPAEPMAAAESVILRDRLRSRNKVSAVEETEKLLARQKVLRKRKLDEIRERFKDGGATSLATSKRSVRKMTSISAYRDPSEYPKDMKPNRVHLDLVKEAVFIPIPGCGQIPFHVSTIRNVFSQVQEQGAKRCHLLRIQFQVPGTAGFGFKADANPFPEVSGPEGMFVKEVILRSSSAALPQTFKNLKDLQKRIKQREETGDTSQDLAVQVPLELNRKGGKRVILKSLMVKTGTQNRRIAGSLECHANGLRFSGGRIENIDINFSNIKHAIFQPCENELLILIHFHLKNPLLVNKKKASDIQFSTEVGSQADDLDQRKGRSSYDPDEIAEELRERELRKKLNLEFKRFVEAVEEMAKLNGVNLEFDLPYRELGFHGVPKNSSLLMLPTSHCLVQLTEWPVFVLTLSEIEIVTFERVFHGLRQFDMVFVFKDYTRTPQQITTVPVESLDTIKVGGRPPRSRSPRILFMGVDPGDCTFLCKFSQRWLNEADIVWYEIKGNLNWTEVLKTIREDAVAFVEDGGFEIFLGEEEGSQDSEESEAESASDEEGDEDYKEASSESSSDDDSDDEGGGDSDADDENSLVPEGSEEDASGSESSGSSDEEGLSWDELEEKAARDDRKRTAHKHSDDDDDDEEERRGKSKKRKR